jgi:hypothetical protein
MPARGTSAGLDSAFRTVRTPGIHNWDISIFKNVPLWSSDGKRYLQLRIEMFNAPNHTQYSDFNRSVTFNQQGQITNLPAALGGGGGQYGFGAINAARDPRFMQLGAKIYW